jgi:hypothetical protein
MELIAEDNAAPLKEVTTSIQKLIRLGYRENQAAEIHTAKTSFSQIQQQRWPSSRANGRSRHHYYLTQVPSDVEFNPGTVFALVYHIHLNFEKPLVPYTSQEIIDMTKTKLQKMSMELGELREPIALLCNSKTDTWNGITRVHIKYLEIDGNALLEGRGFLP